MTLTTRPPRPTSKAPGKRVIRVRLPDYKEIHAEADKLVHGLARDYTGAVLAARARVPADMWALMLVNRKVSDQHIADVVSVMTDMMRPVIERDIRAVVAATGKITLSAFAQRKARAAAEGLPDGAFNLDDPNAIDFILSQGADLVDGIDDEVRAAIRVLLASSFEGNWDVRETARLMPSLVGLSDRQAGAVTRFYASLIADPANSAGRAADLAEAYAGRQLDARALVIARTETIRGANQGVVIGLAQAVDEGYLDPNVQKEWIATDDDITCDECENLDGEQVGLDEDFSSGDDAPPAHPDCRCAVGMAE